MFTTPTNNYVLGRGKIYFDVFDPDSPGEFIKTGERYVGNTPSLSQSRAYQNLDHYSSDYGVREKDDSVQLQVDTTLTWACDNITMANIALMFGAESTIEVTLPITGAAELISVNKDFYYQLGADTAQPQGASNLANVVMTDNTGVHASGTLAFGGNPANLDTVTIGGHVITFTTAAPATSTQVQIGATATVTAQALATLINSDKQLYAVSASGAGSTITLTALASGTAGNAIGTVASGLQPVAGAATLTGGTASGIIVSSGNYEVDLVQGRIHILSNAASITNGMTVELTYDIGAGSQSLVVDEKNQVEGAMRFVADNPKGRNKDWYWPRVKLSPSGEFALKGDTWQTMTFNGEILKLGNLNLVYVTERATA